MFDRWRSAARSKLRRLLLEVVAENDADTRAALAHLSGALRRLESDVGSLATDVRGGLAAAGHAIDALEQRERRDLGFALDRWATATTAQFIGREMPAARTFDHPHDTLRWALSQAPPDGLALEFGVWGGATLRIITPTRPRGTVFGFDSFEGLPETWRTGVEAGAFSAERPPEVEGAELVVGWFEDTLPGWCSRHPDTVAFVHLDADLYSSTVTVLEHLEARLVEGSILVFDEYFNYPGWLEHEHRAWTELVERTGIAFSYEAYTRDNEQVVVRITKPRRTD
jgi:Macrocin-O-methyltransferase (TylF)